MLTTTMFTTNLDKIGKNLFYSSLKKNNLFT